MEQTFLMNSIQQLITIGLIFGCGYVTLFSSFSRFDATDIFFNINSFDKFFICFLWGSGITSISLLLICAISSSISFPGDIEALYYLFNNSIFKVLGFNCFFMTLHDKFLYRFTVEKIVRLYRKK